MGGTLSFHHTQCQSGKWRPLQSAWILSAPLLHEHFFGPKMGHFRHGEIFFVIFPIDRKFSENFMCENLMWQQHCLLTLQLGLFKLNDLGRKTLKGKML